MLFETFVRTDAVSNYFGTLPLRLCLSGVRQVSDLPEGQLTIRGL